MWTLAWIFRGHAMPLEIELQILQLAGPLTRWLCRAERSPLRISPDDARDVWCDALRMNFRHLDQLPARPELSVEDWCLVTSRDYYRHLWSEVHVDAMIPLEEPEEYNGRGDWICNQAYHPLLHVALRQCWWEEFVGSSARAFRNAFWRCVMSVAYGHIEMLETFINNHAATESFLPDRYNVYALLYLSVVGPDGQIRDLLSLAAQLGQLPVLKKFAEHAPYFGIAKLIESAAENGHVHVLEWLYGTYKHSTISVLPNHEQWWVLTTAFAAAAHNGRLEAVKWLHENQSAECHEHVLVKAAHGGCKDVIEYLLRVCPRAIINRTLVELHGNQDLASGILSMIAEASASSVA